MSIYYFKQYLWYLQNFKNIMKENEIFLKNGTYKIIENYSSIKLIEQGKVDNVDTFNGKNKNNFIDNIIYNFCVKPLDIKNKSYKEFYGTCLVRTSSNEEIKIFDLERKLILTRYNSHSRKNNLIDKREYISRITNIPLVVKENDENCYIIEEMIENKEVDKDFIVREIAGLKKSVTKKATYIIEPDFNSPFEYCNLSYETPYGEIKIQWNKEVENKKVKLNVPIGVKVRVKLLDKILKELGSGEYSL